MIYSFLNLPRIPGNVAFRAPSGNSEASEVETGAGLDAAAMLLGLEAKSLADACCKRTMQAPGNCLKFSGDGLGGSSVEVDISYCIDMNDMLVSRRLIHDMSLNSKTIRAPLFR